MVQTPHDTVKFLYSLKSGQIRYVFEKLDPHRYYIQELTRGLDTSDFTTEDALTNFQCPNDLYFLIQGPTKLGKPSWYRN